MAGEKVDELLDLGARLVAKGVQDNLGEAIVADIICPPGPLGKLVNIIKAFDRAGANDPVGFLLHGLDLLSPPVAEIIMPANTLTTLYHKGLPSPPKVASSK